MKSNQEEVRNNAKISMMAIRYIVDGRLNERKRTLQKEINIIRRVMVYYQINFNQAMEKLGIPYQKQMEIQEYLFNKHIYDRAQFKSLVEEMLDSELFKIGFELGYEKGNVDHEEKVCRMLKLVLNDNLGYEEAWQRVDKEYVREV